MADSLTPRRSLWPEDEVEVTPSGFLWIKNWDDFDTVEDDVREEQPLLLQSTARLLRGLYPSLSLKEIHEYKVGKMTEPVIPSTEDEDDIVEAMSNLSVDEKDVTDSEEILTDADSKIPAKYQCYQKLIRVENVSTWASLALADIQTFRHREGPKRPRGQRGNMKVQALEHQQQRLLQMRSESNVSNEINSEDGNDSADLEERSQIIRMVRTINSIRALYPHLLPMLNHPRRNDKQLVIGKTRYKARKKGAMCWLMGEVGFDVATTKALKALHRDAGSILEGFIDVNLAQQIVDDTTGKQDFWTPSAWIHELQCNPEILNPIELLSAKLGKSPSDTLTITLEFDKRTTSHRPADSTENDQHYQKAVSKLHRRLSNILTRAFHGARLSIYGSCLSNLSLGKGSDVDLSLWIPIADDLKRGFDDGSIGADEYSRKMTNLVHQANRKLRYLQSEFRNMQAITRARIPVLSGTFVYADNPYTEDGSIDFDICFLNDIAVANSGLLREYSLVDPRVRTLMMSVKQWAKEFGINSAKDNYISSYTWMNLVVFYLQCIRFLPNLQSPALMQAVGLVPNPKNYWHCVNSLDTCTLTWDALRKANVWIMPDELVEVPMPAMLYGFFEFYGYRFPWTFAVSIKQGDIVVSKLATRKVGAFFSIEDPFETYDSHCPHDLGTPCSENGASFIMRCLRDAEIHLRSVLLGDTDGEKLWPQAPAVEPEPKAVNVKQKQVWKRFDNPTRKADQAKDTGKQSKAKSSPKKKNSQGRRPKSTNSSKGEQAQPKQQGKSQGGQPQQPQATLKNNQHENKEQGGGNTSKAMTNGRRRGGRGSRRGGRGRGGPQQKTGNANTP